MPGNPYDDAVAQVMGVQQSGASAALSNAASLDPDTEARNRQLARTTGLPMPTVRNMPKEAEVAARQQAARDFPVLSALASSPKTATWVAQGDNAAVSHDDVWTLAGIGKQLSEAASDFTPRNLGKSLLAGLYSTASGVAGGVRGAEDFADKYDPFSYLDRAVLGRSLHSIVADRLAGEGRQLSDLAAASRPKAKSQFGQDVLSGVESIPGSLAAMGVTAATGNPFAGAAVLGGVTGGQSYAQARDQDGMTLEGGLTKSAIDAAIETATEIIPEKSVAKFTHGKSGFGKFMFELVGGEVLGEQVATLGQDYNQWVMADQNKGKTFDQYTSEIVPHAISTLTATLTTAGAMGSFAGALRTVDRVSGRAVVREERAAQAEAAAQHFDDLAKLAEASRLRERDAVSFHDFVQHAAEDGPVEAVYVSPEKLGEALNQSGLDPEQAQAAQAAVAPHVAEALANGTDVRLPVADFATYIAPTAAGKALLDHLKADPDGMSREEAKQWMETKGDDLRREVEQTLAEHLADAQFRASGEVVQAKIAEQLHNANRFTREVNETNATGMAAFYSTMAARMGLTPEQLYERMPIRIQAEPVAGEALSQRDTRVASAIEQGYLTPAKWEALTDARLGQTGGHVDARGNGASAGEHGRTNQVQPEELGRQGGQGEGQRNATPTGTQFADADRGGLATFYHGTRDSIGGFDLGHPNRKDAGWLGRGVYLTNDPVLARNYAERKKGPGAPTVLPLHIKLENPYHATSAEKQGLRFSAPEEIARWTDRLIAKGHDGVVLDLGNGTHEIAVFDPANIRSPEAEFDPAKSHSNDLLAQSPFYSPLERAVEQSKTAKASGQQWLATLSKAAGVKKEELEWTGLPEWLTSREVAFTRDEVQAFVRAGGVQVDEVVLGGVDQAAVAERAGELRQEYIEEQLREFDEEYSDEYVDYPHIAEEEDEDGNPVYEVGGETYGILEAAQDAADSLHDELRAEHYQDARSNAEGDAERAADQQDFEHDARSEQGSGNTLFEQYAEKGGEEYRELLITLPEGTAGNPGDAYYHSEHFSDHPVVAHIRFKTRQSTDGKSVMFVEEVQSDWHQQGRDKGYKEKESPQAVAEALARYQEAEKRLGDTVDDTRRYALALVDAVSEKDLPYAAWRDATRSGLVGAGAYLVRTTARDIIVGAQDLGLSANENLEKLERQFDLLRDAEHASDEAHSDLTKIKNPRGIPNAPFKSSWPALAMKRAIRWAADNGIPQIAWTTGKQQSERYNLGATTGDLVVAPRNDDKFNVEMNSQAAQVLENNQLASVQGSGPYGRHVTRMTAEQVKQAFGADVARKVAEGVGAAHTPEQKAQRVELENRKAAADKAETEALHAALAAPASEQAARDEAYANAQQARNAAVRALDAFDRTNPGSFTLSGHDLNVGGEGMRAFYDRNLVNITNDIIKRYGGKVGPVAIEGMAHYTPDDTAAVAAAQDKLRVVTNEITQAGIVPSITDAQLDAAIADKKAEAESRLARWKAYAEQHPSSADLARQQVAHLENQIHLFSDKGRVEDMLATWRQANAELAEAQGRAQGNPGFEITPQLAKAAQEGFALFQQNRGAYSPATDTITLLKRADLSTFLHESGHFYLEAFDRLAADPSAPQDIRDDFDAILKWFAIPGGSAQERAANWRGMSLEQKRASHEKWAQGYEAYLFTGKAPSIKLQAIFQRFRAWMISVYKSALNIGVKPTPAIRSVMDRMLATADEIAEAEQARSMLPLFSDREASGMDENSWREYQARGLEASQDAISELETKALRDMQWMRNAHGRELRKLQQQAKATRAATHKAVTAQVQAEPVYRAIDFLKHGRIDGQKIDSPHRFSIAEIEALYPDAATRDFVKGKLGYGAYGMLGEGEAVHPEQVAELFGFTSADHLIRSIIDAEPMKDRIAGLTEQRLLEEHGDLTDPRAIAEAADKAIHNEARARFVATELAALGKATGKPKILTQAARSYARAIIDRLKVRDIKPSLYEAAAARAGKAAMDNLGKGNRNAAAAEKRNQLINIYAAKEAINAREEVDKAVAYFKRFLTPAAAKSIDREYLDQILGLLDKVDLRTGQTLKAIDRRTSLAEWIKQQQELGFEPIVPDNLLEQLGRKSYKELTVEELRGLRDAIKNIEHLGRLKTKLLTAKRDRDFASAVGKITDRIVGDAYKDMHEPLEKRGWLAKAKDGVFDFETDHRKLASLVREMDGFRDGGPVWEYFIRPMNAAADQEAALRADSAAKIAEIFAPIKHFGAKHYIPEIGQSLSLEGRLAIALNMGNSINRERVTSGERWSPEQLEAILSTLTAEQWAAVQAVWDHIGSYWPQIQAKEQRVTGVAPERVEAEPLRVNTADGQALDLPGGYYPIKYNKDRSSGAEGHDLAEAARQAMRGAYTAATTRRGHTKARAESTGWPLRYDLGVIAEHLTAVIHDLTHHEMLIDVNRLLRSSSIDGAIRDHYGADVRRAFGQTIQAVAAGDVPARNAFERGINYLRTGVTIAGLGFNLVTSLLQPLGVTQSAVRIGPKWVGKGVARWVSDASTFNNTAKWIAKQSPMMAHRGLTQMREMNELRNKVAGKSGVLSAVEDGFFYLIEKAQLVADIPTWLGQYEKSVAAGEDHDTAVALADQAVLGSQGGGQQKDLSEIQRGGPLMKLWTNFYSFFNVSYNLLAESVNETRKVGPSRLPRLAVDVLLLTVVPTTLGVVMRAALHGSPPDPKDILSQNISGLFGLMVGLRDIGSIIDSNGKTSAPSGIVLQQFSDFYKHAKEGKNTEAFWRSANRLGGVLFHYPAAQVDKTARGFEALADGKTSNPGVLLVGPPPKKTR